MIIITLSVEQKSIVITDSWYHWCTIDNWLKQNECYDLVKINNYTSWFLTLFFVLHLYFTETKIWFSTLIFAKDTGFFAAVHTSVKIQHIFLIRNYNEINNFILCHLLMSRSCRDNIKHLLYIYICNTNQLIKKCMCLLITKYN